MTHRNNGGEPPPTRKSKTDRKSRTTPPYFLSMNKTAHIVTKAPTITARIPDTKKLGIIVKAGSVAPDHNFCPEPMASMTKPLVVALPWRISNMPCSMPASPTIAPSVEATILVALIDDFGCFEDTFKRIHLKSVSVGRVFCYVIF
jgi:hypothetical protein